MKSNVTEPLVLGDEALSEEFWTRRSILEGIPDLAEVIRCLHRSGFNNFGAPEGGQERRRTP